MSQTIVFFLNACIWHRRNSISQEETEQIKNWIKLKCWRYNTRSNKNSNNQERKRKSQWNCGILELDQINSIGTDGIKQITFACTQEQWISSIKYSQIKWRWKCLNFFYNLFQRNKKKKKMCGFKILKWFLRRLHQMLEWGSYKKSVWDYHQ